MAKAPAIQFYVRDWTADCNGLSVAAKGAWIQILCQLHLATKRGELTKTPGAWARVCGCTTDEFDAIVGELTDEEIARVTLCNGRVTVVSRRFERERKEREAAALRQRKHRAGQDGHKNVTIPSASAVSASATAEETTPPLPPSDLPLEVGGVGPPPDRQPVVEVSEAARIVTDLIDEWNATKGNRRLCLSTGETLETAIRKKIIERGIPILEIPKFTLGLIESSVGEWKRHCKQIRTDEGRTARTPPWGLGYIANAWFAADEKHQTAAKSADTAAADANTAAQELLTLKAAKDDKAAMLKAWAAIPLLERKALMDAARNQGGAIAGMEPIVRAEWWLSAAGGKGQN